MRRMRPSKGQIAAARAVARWYIGTHFDTPGDPGLLRMFTDPTRVGAFAVTLEEIARRDGAALFRLLVATTMFQRRQDLQVLRILQGIPVDAAREIGDANALLRLVDGGRCPWMKTTAALREHCDLTKENGRGTCGVRPRATCHLKRHTVTL